MILKEEIEMKFFRKMRKLIAGICIGLGVRNITYSISSYKCLANYNRSWFNNSRNKLFIQMLNNYKTKEEFMTVVVRKAPKCFRGILKFIFGIKKES